VAVCSKNLFASLKLKMTTDKKFACAINCMDGRVQDAVDMVTEPGPNKIICNKDACDTAVIEDIKKRVEISVHHHGSKVVAVVGHFGCAGNPAPKEEQIEQLKKCKGEIESFGFPVEVVLLWVDGDWTTVEKI